MVLRLAGLWLIWSAWCSTAGWLLSAFRQLDGFGYGLMLPLLLGIGVWWMKATGPRQPVLLRPAGQFLRRLRRPAPLVFVVIALLSLVAGLSHAPWGSDETVYRLPRILYWWSAHHWHWIGTVDRRLDYSSTGFEWQMLPVIQLTRSDRFLFLLNWLPFLLMPGLVFVVFRGLGVAGSSARRWMWLLPSGYGFALQCSGLQNDGYTVNYLLAAIGFGLAAFYRQRLGLALLSLLAVALLTGAKLSNLPLLLPLGVLMLPMLPRVRWRDWRLPAVLAIAVLCSCAPLVFFCWQNTGDWAGDPDDQWNIKTHGAVGAVGANTVILLNDAAQVPFLPVTRHLEPVLERINHSALMTFMERAHRQFTGVHFGEMPYEGGAGLGFGLAAYLLFLLLGSLCLTARPPAAPTESRLPWAWRLAPWLAWFSFLVFLAKLGSYQSARIAAPYYPLLLVTLLRSPRVAALERKNIAGVFAVMAAATVLPVILFTPARPVFPIQTLAAMSHRPALDKLAAKYRFWDNLRDGLAPLRAQLPPTVTQLGYAGGFGDSAYYLYPPFGSRKIVELGLPLGSNTLPPPDLSYAVVTRRGLQTRYHLDLDAWLARVGGQVIFEHPRNITLDAHTPAKYESWYLVKLSPDHRQP